MKKVILIVEDDPECLKATANFLKLEGFRVREAKNGADALKKILESVPDLILSDIKMPKIDGYELVKHIRSNPATEILPFIFVTGLDETQNKIEGFRNGIDAFITKPIEFEELSAVIENILARVDKTKEKYKNLIDAANEFDFRTEIEALTKTENKIARAVARGLTNKDIAEEFNNSVRTIENHISRILAKKSLNNRVEIARLVLEKKSASTS